MGKTILEISISLDGFAAGTDVSVDLPMGEGGAQLHRWLFEGKTDADAKIIEDIFNESGAVIVGGNTYHTAIGKAWGGISPFTMPAFVVTSRMPRKTVEGFSYIENGIGEALRQAQRIAGEKNVWVMGGAQLASSFLAAGLLDEMHIHIAPIILGKGTRLFEALENAFVHLNSIDIVSTPAATHIRYKVHK